MSGVASATSGVGKATVKRTVSGKDKVKVPSVVSDRGQARSTKNELHLLHHEVHPESVSNFDICAACGTQKEHLIFLITYF